jgi:hypothetical protein
MNNTLTITIRYILCACVLFLNSTQMSYAYRISVEADTIHSGVYNILLDTQGQSFNAISGTVLFTDTLPHVPRIHTASSIIPLWVKAPTISGNSVTFEGIYPGGFTQLYDQFGDHTDTKVTLFSLAFPYEKDISEFVFSFDGVTLYANDGLGISQNVTGAPVYLQASYTDAVVDNTDVPEKAAPFYIGWRFFAGICISAGILVLFLRRIRYHK